MSFIFARAIDKLLLDFKFVICVLQFVSFKQSTLASHGPITHSLFPLCHTETSNRLLIPIIMSATVLVFHTLRAETSGILVNQFMSVSQFLCFIHCAQRQVVYSSTNSSCLCHSSCVSYNAHCDEWWTPCAVYYKYLWVKFFILTRSTFWGCETEIWYRVVL
jgi:hypothetical protein